VLKPLQSPQSRHGSSKRDGLLKCLPQDMVGPGHSSPGAAGTATTWSRAPDCIYDRASFLLDKSIGPAAPSRGVRGIYGLAASRAGYCDRISTRSMHPNWSPLHHRLWWRLRSRRCEGSLPLPLHPSRKSSTNCRSPDYAIRLRVFTLLRCYRDVRGAAVQEEPR
jgi:hypothetical protein